MEGEQQQEGQQPTFDWMPEGKSPLADGEYDVIILGTGLKECIMSGLLSVNGKKVLVVDRNDYYGGDCASLNLTNLYAKFRDNATPPEKLGSNRDYNVDLVPKFIMACGKLVKILLHSKVTRYLEFKNVDGSYVMKDGKTYKVPATPDEAIRTSLMGMFEKRRFRNMLKYFAQHDPQNPKTWDGLELDRVPMRAVYDKFGVDKNTQTFTGHAMALKTDDQYLGQPALDTVEHIKLYVYSLERYGKSPYIYPIYGLGGLPEGFSRLCAIHGGTFMLHRSVDEIMFNEEGKAWGIRCGDEVARSNLIIGDPSYFPQDKLKKTGKVLRSICILNHPIPNTNNAESVQIIIPASQVNRKNDIYIAAVSFAHCVAPKGFWIAILSTTVETSSPASEIQKGIELLGPVLERFDSVSDTFEPVGDGSKDLCYISKSYDATSHFETTSDDVLDLYKRVTGEELDMTISADSTDAEENM